MKRTPMKRSAPLRRDTSSRLTVKPKKCRVCREEYTPSRPMQIVCGPACGYQHARNIAAADAKKAATEQGKRDRAQREALKTIPELVKEAQTAFNTWIRTRDRLSGVPCICCGSPLDWGAQGVRGHSVDAGHYRSTGSAPHLRFDERNVHAQRVICNRHGAGRAVDYRIGLIRRIGLQAVEALETDYRVRKWTREELRDIRNTYRAKTKAATRASLIDHAPQQ